MKHSGVSSFSVILTFVTLSLLSIAFIPLLSIQFSPSHPNARAITVNFQWPNASARIIEQEVTSKLEGLLSTLTGLENIESVSSAGSGYINLTFNETTKLEMTRFEIAMLIRQVKQDLPFGVSYPSISLGSTGRNVKPILTYTLNGSISPYFLQTYAEEHLKPRLSLPGVSQVFVSKGSPYQWEIEFKNDALKAHGINANEIQTALTSYFEEENIGKGLIVLPGSALTVETGIKVKGHMNDSLDWGSIPIRRVNERVVYLRDLASIGYHERPPSNYSRINGLNSIIISVLPEDGINTMRLAKQVRAEVERFRKNLPNGYSLLLIEDATVYLANDLERTAWRSILSLCVILAFVWLISREIKYMFIVVVSMIVNLLIACIFYYLFEVEIHLYSITAITISFGIIIDNTIVMIDHFRVNKNKKVLLALIGATLSTMAALCIIFFLEAEQQINLIDFAWIILINLVISLVIAYYFIPALMDKIKLYNNIKKLQRHRTKKVIWITQLYKRYVQFGVRYTWVFIIVLVFSFGIPMFMLPERIGKETIDDKDLTLWAWVYNNSIGSKWFGEVRPILEKVVGGSLRLFVEDVFEGSYNSDPDRIKLSVHAAMPEGSSTQQMNETIMQMENLITKYKEVEWFETSVNSTQPPSATIDIRFKPEFEYSNTPFTMKAELENKAMDLGGAEWQVIGMPFSHFGQNFSNSIGSTLVSRKITLQGYNYDQLYHHASELKVLLEEFPRIENTLIVGSPGGFLIQRPFQEYYVDFNKEQMARQGLSMKQLYDQLSEWSFQKQVLTTFLDNKMQSVWMVSDRVTDYKIWDFINTDFDVNNIRYKMNGLARIDKRLIGNAIYKYNQQYRLEVSYNFVGSNKLEESVRHRMIDRMNNLLPLGYTAYTIDYNVGLRESHQYYLLGLIAALVFLICSVLFESLRQPFAILMLIPFPFIGVFLTFWLFEINFDQGGYASFVLLIGLSVNAGIYIVNDYNILKRKLPTASSLRLYVKAFNHKVIPILLTIFSTAIGLVPFVLGVHNEVFWFAFAAGTIGGLILSFVGFYFFLPVFLLRIERK